MELLLDTHILLWCTDGNPRLKAETQRQISAADRVYISSATIWEAAIKSSLGKLHCSPDELIRWMDVNGLVELPVRARHARLVASLPHLHGDPFDRMLVAQAIDENLRFMTADAHLAAYSDLVMIV